MKYQECIRWSYLKSTINLKTDSAERASISWGVFAPLIILNFIQNHNVRWRQQRWSSSCSGGGDGGGDSGGVAGDRVQNVFLFSWHNLCIYQNKTYVDRIKPPHLTWVLASWNPRTKINVWDVPALSNNYSLILILKSRCSNYYHHVEYANFIQISPSCIWMRTTTWTITCSQMRREHAAH